MNIPEIHSTCGKLIGILYQSYVPKILKAAIEVHLFEALALSDTSLSELSSKLKTDKAVTEALLDVLMALDLVTKQSNTYSLTQTAKDFLVKDSGANQLGAIQKFSGSVGPFDRLIEVLLSGPSAFDSRMWGSREAVLDMEQQHKGGAIQAVLSFVKEIPEFNRCRKMCDFLGNIGYFSFALMEENEKLIAHVYDLPEVCALGREIKKEERNYDRVIFHDFDINSNETFGEGYDLFFGSHTFFYDFNARGTLVEFLEKVNRSMKQGGLFVSNHITPASTRGNHLIVSIIELMTRSMGYPTHQLPEEDLRAALSSTGFGNFKTRLLEEETSFPVLLLSAVKE